jgi:hypothetical protein
MPSTYLEIQENIRDNTALHDGQQEWSRTKDALVA